jgi:DNA-binding NarL/FixJ family response regulator
MDLTEIQKQTIALRLRDGISIRAIAAEVGVHKRTILLQTEPLLKKPCLHNSHF